jgi:hypothetical protein
MIWDVKTFPETGVQRESEGRARVVQTREEIQRPIYVVECGEGQPW